MAADTVAMVLIVSTAWLTYFFVLPWMCKLMTIYALHGLRDRVFRIGLRFPNARRGLLFRDIDYFLAYSVHIARDAKYSDVLAFTSVVGGTRKANAEGWRLDQYREEDETIFIGEAGRNAKIELLAVFNRLSPILVLRTLTGHPGMLLVAILASFILLGKTVIALY